MDNDIKAPCKHPQYLDYHYRELVRLSDVQNSHLNNAFADFKLLGVVGVMLAWKPLTDAFVDNTQPLTLLIGFVTILFVVLLISLFQFMRQSIMLYYLEQVKHHEVAVRRALDLSDEESFAVATNWRAWSKKIHEPIAWRMFMYLYSLLVAFPVAVLLASNESMLAFTYLIISLVLIGVHACVTAVIIRQVDHSTCDS